MSNRKIRVPVAKKQEPAKIAKVVEAPKKKAKPANGNMIHHKIHVEFAGSSKPYGVKRNKTPLRVEKFGSLKGDILSDRDLNLLRNIKAEYKGESFERGDYDAGALSRLGERGYVELVSGPANSVNAVLRLTEMAA